jgi:hypothetical protein
MKYSPTIMFSCSDPQSLFFNKNLMWLTACTTAKSTFIFDANKFSKYVFTYPNVHCKYVSTAIKLINSTNQHQHNGITLTKQYRAQHHKLCVSSDLYCTKWFLKLWYAYHYWYMNHCLLVWGVKKKIQI